MTAGAAITVAAAAVVPRRPRRVRDMEISNFFWIGAEKAGFPSMELRTEAECLQAACEANLKLRLQIFEFGERVGDYVDFVMSIVISIGSDFIH